MGVVDDMQKARIRLTYARGTWERVTPTAAELERLIADIHAAQDIVCRVLGGALAAA
jgi:hypothetical protein